MGLNQKTTALTEQALAESNESQVLIQAILGRLVGLDTMAGNISIIAEDAEVTRHPITATAGNTAAATLALQAILDKLNANAPLDTTALHAKLQAIIDLLAAQQPTDVKTIVTKLQAILDLLAAQQPTDVTTIVTKLQAILDLLADEVPVDTASIVTAIHAETAETHEIVARLDYIGDQANLAAVKAAVLEVVSRLDYIGDQANLAAVKAAVLEVVSRLDYIGDQANLAAVKAAVLDVVARLDYIGDQANLAAIKAAIEALQARLPVVNLTEVLERLDRLLWYLPRIQGDTDGIGNLSGFIREASDLSNEKLELIISRLDRAFNVSGLPMQGLSLGELLWNILINTRALVPKDPQTSTPEVSMTLSHSTKMTLLPTGEIPYIGSYNVLVAGWDAPPAGTAFGLGQFNLPDNTVLTAPDGWAGWYIYTQSSGKNFAVTLASLQRYFTNEWMPIPTEVTNELHVYVEGTEDIRVWLAQSVPSGGGGGDPGPTPDEWYAETMKLNGVQIDVTFPAQANSNFTGSQTYTSVDNTAVVCVCYGTLSQAVTFRSSDGSEWTVWNGDSVLAVVDATGTVLGPYPEPMRIHVNAPDGANIGSVIMTSANWPTAFIPV